ncbi:MAG: heavy-metal-associated domain-containing protein [Anaerolineaceae bacterium]|nr:heavy-metal-associated domain-containing protein [Anaerolineaceae bacterium]
MQISSFNTPGLYADHHVSEVRKHLLELPGVQSVYASSAFQIVEVTYDESKLTQDVLNDLLDRLGYLSEIQALAESGTAASGDDAPNYRHTVTYTATRKTVSFQQQVPYSGRPLFVCPGIGTIKPMDN